LNLPLLHMSSVLVVESVAEVTDPYLPYRRGLLSPERVRQLSDLKPAIAVRDTLVLTYRAGGFQAPG